jgi:hypothetical protein
MNKFTYLLLLLFCMMGGVTKAYAGIGDPLEKEGWSITASSWCWDDRVDGNGKYDRIIDGNIHNFWHSNWGNQAGGEGDGGSLPQWFIVDIGSVQEIGGVIYTPRQEINNNNTNGACKNYKVFVSENPFEVTDQASVNALTGEVASGSFEYTIAPKQVSFNNKQNAQYVMFVITDSYGSVPGRWATCAEFDVCSYAETASVTYNYTLNGVVKHSTSVVQTIGSNYNAPAIDFITFTQPTGTVQVGENNVTVECTENLPFEKTTDLNSPKWFAIDMHSNSNRYMWHYEADNQNIKVAVPEDLVSISKDDAYFYCLTGNVFDGFQIYNKKAGTNKSLNTTTDKPQITEGEHTTWHIVKPQSSISNAACFKANNTQYLNHQGDNTLGYWANPDEGSSCRFFKPATVAMEQAEVLANIPANAVGGYLNVENLDPAITEAEKDLSNFENANKLVDAIKALQSNGITFEESAYYRIVNAFTAFDVQKCMLSVSGNTYIQWGSLDLKDINNVFQLEKKSNGKYSLKNVNRGQYMQGAAGLLGNKETAADMDFAELGCAQYNIHYTNGNCHTNGHNNGKGDKGNLVAWNGGQNTASAWYLVKVDKVEVALNTAGNASYATTYLPFSVSNVEGATAYIGKKVNESTLQATAIEAGIPANTGVILKGAANEAKAVLTLGNATSDVTGNALTGTLVEKDYTDELVFGKSAEGAVGFYSMAAGKKIGANKAYLEAAAAQAMKLVFDGDVTGIENVMGEAADANAPIYDLTGRRVMKAVKGGLYIQNGKKFIAQ